MGSLVQIQSPRPIFFSMSVVVLTNDDGVHAPGLAALERALAELGDVYVLAPEREQSACGHALTLHRPLRPHQLGERRFAVNGTPSDCVNLAVLGFLPAPPVLVVSGINHGANLGDDVTYSGTVSAAMEGTILGVPSMAVSQEGQEHFYFDAGARYAVRIARLILKESLPDETLVNLNIPNRAFRSITGVRVTCLSRRRFDNPIIEKVDPHGRTYYWIAGTRVSWSRSKDADHEALEQGAVSLTPIHLDTTNYVVLDRFRKWETVRRPDVR